MQEPALRHISLDALRVFSAAARHRSFTLAAKELFVTQVAVSKRIKGLEQQLGFELFVRSGRRIDLTERGARLAARVDTALNYLATEINALQPGSTTGEVAISAAASVSQLWLSPRLQKISHTFPHLKIVLNTTDRISDLENSPDALSILYAVEGHPEWSTTLLFSEELIPMAAPSYLAQAGITVPGEELAVQDLSTLDCIDYRRANAAWFTLRMWFQAYLPDQPVPAIRITVSNYGTAVLAALEGNGVILGSRHMLADFLARGDLVELTTTAHVTGNGYFLGRPRSRSISEDALTLWNALAPASVATIVA
ncbi:LysR substrate-binding domain-containing protein [Yoonia sp. R2331]|uniref:LysR substrate-binding domain-containing protein n=1 Tax=Yoonia sp. R2331 TaxID=3237238 RepID=UPI0034E51ADA